MQKIFWFALTLGCMEHAGYSQTTSQPVPDGPGVYVVRVISVDPARRDSFVACLAQSDLPYWRGLKEKGVIAKVSVFETTAVTKSGPGVPAWNFAISSRLGESARADSFVQLLEKRKGCESVSGVEVRRMETMQTPANLTGWGRETAADDLKAREWKVEFGIEYIAVRDTPEALHRWSEFMRLYEAPAAGLLIRDGWGFSALALETVKVNYSQAGMPNWNNIHFVGRMPGKDPEARKAAAEAARREAIPANVDITAERASISGIATNLRNDSVRQLFELAVR